MSILDENAKKDEIIVPEDSGLLGLERGKTALKLIGVGVLAIVLTGGFAAFLGFFCVFPMIVLPFFYGVNGLYLSIKGLSSNDETLKNNAKKGILLNSVLLVALLVFGSSFLMLL